MAIDGLRLGLPCRMRHIDQPQVEAKVNLLLEQGWEGRGFLELVCMSDDIFTDHHAIIQHSAWAGDQGIRVEVVHAPIPPREVSSFTAFSLAGGQGVYKARRAAILAKEVEAKKLVLHCNCFSDSSAAEDDLEDRVISHLKQISKISKGVICIEVMPDPPYGDCLDLLDVRDLLGHHQIENIVSMARAANVQICFDTCHVLTCHNTLVEPFEQCSRMVSHVHLSDLIRGVPFQEGVPLGEGAMRLDDLRDFLEMLLEQTTITLEVNDQDHVQIKETKRALAFLKTNVLYPHSHLTAAG